MITIFAVPLPFSGGDKTNQHNAIKSWMRISPRPEIILLGNEKGVAGFAKANNLVHIPLIGKTVDGYISIASMF